MTSYVCLQDLESINHCLKTTGETPVVKKKLVHTSYTKEKKILLQKPFCPVRQSVQLMMAMR